MFEIAPLNHRNHYAVYNPFRDMDDFEKTFFSPDAPFFSDKALDLFKTDIREDDAQFVLEADLPGFDKKDINVDIDGDNLTIKAERHSQHEDKDKKNSFVRCERSYGSYCRSFDISAINADAITAKYDNGVLTLKMPKKEEKSPASKQLSIE